jgi:hypothetical protein
MPRRARAFAILLALLILLLIVVWQPDVVSNAPVDALQAIEAVVPMPASVASTLTRSCYNCHSNQTAWPWYAHLRPIASRIRNDVRDGRRSLNFSEWRSQTGGSRQVQKKTLQTSCALMQAGMMPPPYYLYIHPDAKLTNRQVREFCAWAANPPGMKQ